jgi:hypothetical protein
LQHIAVSMLAVRMPPECVVSVMQVFYWINKGVPGSGTTREQAPQARAQAAGPHPIPCRTPCRTNKQGSCNAGMVGMAGCMAGCMYGRLSSQGLCTHTHIHPSIHRQALAVGHIRQDCFSYKRAGQASKTCRSLTTSYDDQLTT